MLFEMLWQILKGIPVLFYHLFVPRKLRHRIWKWYMARKQKK